MKITSEELLDRCVWTLQGQQRTATITHRFGLGWTVEDHRGVIAAASDELSGETDAEAWERMLSTARRIAARVSSKFQRRNT